MMARRSRFSPAAKEAAQKAAQEATQTEKLKKRFETRVQLSWLALFAERVLEALLWPFMVVCAFLVFTFLGGWSLLPPIPHRILLGLFGVAFLVSLLPLLRIAFPTRAEALRRLERDSNIKHRPASSYEDTLHADPRTDTAQLWTLHRQRLARHVAKLKSSWPAPRADREDPYAIRAALFVSLIAAFLAGGSDIGQRLKAAFSLAVTASPALLRLDAWVAPPVYTGIAPIVLADGNEAVGHGAESFRALSVPQRSQLIVRTHAPEGDTITLTVLNEDGSEAGTIEPKTGAATGLVEFNVGLMEPLTADMRIGGSTVAQWQFAMITDVPPQIGLAGEPTSTPRGALRLEYGALDDYGVASAEARFELADEDPQSLIAPAQDAEEDEEAYLTESEPLFGPPVMKLQLPRANAKKIEGRSTQDLTAHPWAGLNVRMTLVARDQAEQTGESEAYAFQLPARVFTKPLAKAVIELRRKLVRSPNDSARVARALDALTLGGEKVIDDGRVYLSMRNAYWRLTIDDTREAVVSVADQLWATALRLEEGDLPEAERALKTAQDALKKALQENAPAEEINRRIQELRAALAEYLKALAGQQQDKGNMTSQAEQSGDALVSEQDLDKMLENIQDLAESGSKEMAERMLSELNDILERLQTGNFPENAKQQRAQEMMKELDDVVSDQQELLDDTFAEKRHQREGQGGGQNEQFDVSPPGQPIDFGLGMSMAPFFDQMPQSGQSGARAQGQSGRQGDAPGAGQTQTGQQQNQQQGSFGELHKRQQALRKKLESLVERMRAQGGDGESQFAGAEEAMREAEEALGEKNLDRATQSQSIALERMREGAQSMAQQMMEDGQMQAGQGPGSNGRDPLGRPDRSNRPDLGLSVQLPDEIDIQRAREVLDELRRRIGDPTRPSLELDYLERLIRSF